MSITEEILDKIDIVDLISRYVNLKKVGKNYVWLCPFHREKTPSFTVAPDKQIFKCFWCGIGWNAIKFVMEYEKLDFPDAIKFLAEYAWVDLSKWKKNDSWKEHKILEEKQKYLQINNWALSFFKQQLKQNSQALLYLTEKRKLPNQIIEQFQLWYAPESYYQLIEYLTSKWANTQDLIKIWLAKKGQNDVYAFFRNRIIFPIFDHMDNLVAFAARALSDQDQPKYLNTPETILYDKSKILYWLNIAKNYINQFDKIIVVEGYMDVIALARANMPIGVATCWTALSTKHLRLLKRFTENIIFGFDNDQAWFQATIRWIKLAFENWVFPKVLILPNWYKDLDELINDKWDIADLLNYQDAFEYIIKSLQTTYDLSSIIDQKKFFNEIFDILKSLYNYWDLQALDWYIELFANKIKKDPQNIKKQFFTYMKNYKNYLKNDKEILQDKIAFSPEEKIAALIYNQFYKQFDIENKLQSLIDILAELTQYDQSSLIYHTITDQLTLEQVDKLKQLQLDREHQNATLQVILKHLKDFIKNYIQFLLKNQKIPNQDKQKMLSYLPKIAKL